MNPSIMGDVSRLCFMTILVFIIITSYYGHL